jgi:pullulanase/glycogen debranching enzyme
MARKLSRSSERIAVRRWTYDRSVARFPESGVLPTWRVTGDDHLYVMINAYWQTLQFQIQEGLAHDWVRVIDTDLPSPNDFSEHGLPVQQSIYQVAPRSVVVLVRS